MKVPLNQDVVLKMSLSRRPEHKASASGKTSIVYAPFDGGEYITYDSSQNSPRGFGVRVGKTGKSYIVQRAINGKVTKWVVGKVGDLTIDEAREKAREGIQISIKHGVTPTKVERERAANELTLGECFDDYRSFLVKRNPPAKENSLLSMAKGRSKFKDWDDRKVTSLSSKMIVDRFDALVPAGRTAAEAACRWANAAVNRAIKVEAEQAKSQRRDPTLEYNPFITLKTQEMYRTRAQLAQDYKRKGIRNPMDPMDNLGKWVQAVWNKKAANPTGADFLLLTLLWGMRKTEASQVKWRHRIDAAEAAQSSWVDLAKRKVYLFDPKNRSDHELPIAPCALELLRRRDEEGPGRVSKWVFPARSSRSATGHYSDCNSLLKYVREEAGIDVLRPHDLRRTFGRIAEDLGFPYSTIQRLLNHVRMADSTVSYSEQSWPRLAERMERLEEAILGTYPVALAALRPVATA
ncbi:tyrosine-type recombinase/integrase [Massilia sp. TSP1-1-2]|uniref:tyrosine-type recombinase/integrase n=1 Tax=Massilia sp. TSP1-1-2 TaxID=2804649 RepID=UPI003CF82BD8